MLPFVWSVFLKVPQARVFFFGVISLLLYLLIVILIGLVACHSLFYYRLFCFSCLFSFILENQEASMVSRSSTKAEYHSMAITLYELKCLQCLLYDFHVPVLCSIPLYIQTFRLLSTLLQILYFMNERNI